MHRRAEGSSRLLLRELHGTPLRTLSRLGQRQLRRHISGRGRFSGAARSEARTRAARLAAGRAFDQLEPDSADQNSSMPAAWPIGKMCQEAEQMVSRAWIRGSGCLWCCSSCAGFGRSIRRFEVEGSALEQRGSAGYEAFFGAAEGIAEVLDR